MSRKDQAELAKQQRALLKIEKPFARDVKKEKNRYIVAQSNQYEISTILSDDLLIQHTQNINNIFKKYYTRAIRLAVNYTERAILELKADIFTFIFAQWITDFGGDNVIITAQTTQNDIRNILNAALAAEAPTAVAARSILTARGLSPWRAATIARTETHNAAMYASQKTAETVSSTGGIEILKKWVPALDERTRTNHAAMTRHPAIALDAFFTVGDVKMARPGDPIGGPSNVINCRCVLVYKRKQQSS